jgi:hypothetical protein
LSGKRNPRAGLFNGWFTDLDGKNIRRVRRDEYGELYRLYRKHAGIRLGIRPIGQRQADERLSIR